MYKNTASLKTSTTLVNNSIANTSSKGKSDVGKVLFL